MAHVSEHQSRDVDDQAKALEGWQQSYEQLGCGRFEGSAWLLEMEDGMLLRESTNRPLREQIVPPSQHVVLALPLAVADGSVFAGRPLHRDSLMILNGQDEYDVVAAGEMDLIGVCLHRDLVAAAMSAQDRIWLEWAEAERSLPLNAAAAAALRQMLAAVCARAEARLPELDCRAREAELLTQAFAQAVGLVLAWDEGEVNSAVPRRADTRMKVVRRAVDFMRANLHNEIGIPEVCLAACSCRRSLQYCFEEFLRTTPQAYLRALRLNEARRTLKLHADQPITALANTLGFSSASHFTRHYKLMFDELPSDTLKLNCYLTCGV